MEEKDYVMSNGAYDEDDIGVLTIDNLEIDVEKLPNLAPRAIPEFDQSINPYTNMSCTISNRYWQALYVFDKPHSKELWYEFLKQAEKDWWVAWEWRWTPTWLNSVRRLWNTKYPDEQFVFCVLTKSDVAVKQFLDKGYPVAYTFRGNWAMMIDAQRDWRLDDIDWWVPTFWHTTNIIKNIDYPNREAKYKNIDYATSDNSWWRRWYQYPVYAMNNFLNFRWMYDNTYVIIPLKFVDKSYAELIEQRKKDKELLLKAQEDWIWNGKNINEWCLRYEFILMLMRKNGYKGTDDELLAIATEKKIWNWKTPYKPILRYEAVLMIMRIEYPTLSDTEALQYAKTLWMWNWLREYSTASRQEVVLMSARC